MPFAPLNAALPPGWVAAGLLDVVGPLLVVAFWVIRQVLVALKEQREQEAARKEAEQRGEQWPPAEPAVLADEAIVEKGDVIPPRPAAPAAQPAQVDLRSEVEEFLRRASQGKLDVPPAPQPKPPKNRPPLDPFDEPPPRKRRQPRQKPVTPDTVELSVEPPPVPVSQVKLRHLPDSQLAENAAQLGKNIATADDRVEARLHEKFDHRLGNLANRSAGASSSTAEPTSAAGRIRKMLVAPGGAREAVILSEILRSPADRL